MNYIEVAVDAPLQDTLTYTSITDVSAGTSVTVPLGKRKAKGVILQATQKPKFKTKDIDSINEDLPTLPKAYLSWLQWMSQYYMHPIGQIAQMFFPPLKKGGKSRKGEVVPTVEAIPPPSLSEEQKTIVSNIQKKQFFNPFNMGSYRIRKNRSLFRVIK